MNAIIILFLFIIGACIGSFLNVLIYRLPRGESIVFPGSHCPSCGRAIKWYDNIPIISWFVLRGRCRFCKQPISLQYPLIELSTAIILSGLYICYFVLHIRSTGKFHQPLQFARDWPMFVAHAVLLCGLLAVSVVDVQLFIVPVPVMWFCSLVGIVASAYRPGSLMPTVSPAIALASLGAVVGLVISWCLVRTGYLQRSFLDANDKFVAEQEDKKVRSIAITAKNGVNPRKEILREVLFLAPAIVLGIIGFLLVKKVPWVNSMMERLWCNSRFGPHLSSGMGAVFGFLVGGGIIWSARILGTLAFGKEAMGMGDVHILAAIGAVAGWKVAILTFFVAPLLGLIWAMYLLLARGKRELPYGPWLAGAATIVLLFYDSIISMIFRTHF